MPLYPILGSTLLLLSSSVFALQIATPDVAENGAVIPVTIRLDTPLTAGQQLQVIVNDVLTAQVKVQEGKISSFTTRVKGAQNNTVITANVISNGVVQDSGNRELKVTITAAVSGTASAPGGNMRTKKSPGEIKLLMMAENGFADAIVLQDSGFKAEIVGSNGISKNPFITITGNFTDQISVTTGSISVSTPPSASTTSNTNSAPAKPIKPLKKHNAKRDAGLEEMNDAFKSPRK